MDADDLRGQLRTLSTMHASVVLIGLRIMSYAEGGCHESMLDCIDTLYLLDI
jgi:hypothetical protein